jgi:lambda family phage portal protein
MSGSKILGPNGKPFQADQSNQRNILSRYDAAELSEETRQHYRQVDSLSARGANSHAVRQRLRDRCRYEVANNSWASGVADALADFMVGDGPKLQCLTKDREFNSLVESEFGQWAEAVCLADKCWLLRRERAVDGEGFIFLENDPGLGAITLDLREYEPEQVATPYFYPLDPLTVDGIELSQLRKPAFYHLLYEHPGDLFNYRGLYKFERVPAKLVIHWFRATRAGQYRGIPEFTQSLGLFADLRRYRQATIAAAETAASFAAMLYTENPPEQTDLEPQAWEKIPIDRRMLTTVPAGWKMAQLKAEQPSTGHPEFVRTCLTELATGHSTTYEIASGDYSHVNYSSGRLAHQRFNRSINVDRCRMERNCLNIILREWLKEAVLIRLLPDVTTKADGWAHRWLWPATEAIDPLKEARAQQVSMESYMTTFSEECARDGVDRDVRLAEIKRDVEDFAAMGQPSPYGKPAPLVAPQNLLDPSQEGDSSDGPSSDQLPSDPGDSGDDGDTRANFVHRNGWSRP